MYIYIYITLTCHIYIQYMIYHIFNVKPTNYTLTANDPKQLFGIRRTLWSVFHEFCKQILSRGKGDRCPQKGQLSPLRFSMNFANRYYMYPICIRYVSFMYPICILYVSYMYPICILYVSNMYPICFLYVSLHPETHAICIVYVFYMYPICILPWENHKKQQFYYVF